MSATYDPFHEAKLIEEIGVLPDRLVGLLAPIALDHHLVQAIKVRWVDDGEVLDELLRDGGPIGSFGIRVRIGFAMGLYCEETYRDLLRLNKIRNLFAHKLEVGSFVHQQAQDLAMALSLPRRFLAVFDRDAPQRAKPDDRWKIVQRFTAIVDTNVARGRFLRAVEIADAYLAHLAAIPRSLTCKSIDGGTR